jgi:hypothetical protein
MITIDEAYDAIKYQDIDTLNEYLSQNTEPNPQYILMLNKMFSAAVRWNNIEAMEALVANGADPIDGSSDNFLQGKERGDLDVNNYLYNGKRFNFNKFIKDDSEKSC